MRPEREQVSKLELQSCSCACCGQSCSLSSVSYAVPEVEFIAVDSLLLI